VAGVDAVLARALADGGGVLRWADVAGKVPRWAVDNACRSGRLVRLLPTVFVDPAGTRDPDLRVPAALAYAGGRAALSHLTALAVWRLGQPGAERPVHVTVPTGVRVRSGGWLNVHHVRRPPDAVVRGGLAVIPLESALVGSWPLLSPADRPGPVVDAVAGRMTTPARLTAVVEAGPRLAGRAELRRLVDRLSAGCRSELEIRGHDRVFTGPGMPPFRRQHPVRLGGRTVYLDVFAERELVAFELDGAAYHGDSRQREADLRRDAALFAQERIVTIRYAHRRLVTEPDAVRREVLAILRDPKPAICRERA
jgi:hypothetical protein